MRSARFCDSPTTAGRKTPSTSIRAWQNSLAACIASTASSWSCSTSTACSKSHLTCWRHKIAGKVRKLELQWKRPFWDLEQAEAEMRTCLVVDDSSVIRKVARRILEGLDFQILEAEDGQKALEVCKRGLPDAILLDWNMPVMDGYEFLGNLRRMPGGDQPKVVFCTTENDVAHIARALHAGANEYIMKPFDKDIVTAKFQEVGLIEFGEPA